MEKQRNKVCGSDVHKKFHIATIRSRDGSVLKKRFEMSHDELIEFKDWVIENKCEAVAIESTGVYWYPIFAVLEGHVEVIVANAYQIKHTPGRKTDASDSEWIAELCLNDMIEPSRIFPNEDRQLRELTRAREAYVNNRTQMKNRIHWILESASIKLSSVLSDIFGKSGMHILNGLLDGKNIDNIIKSIPSGRVKKKEDQIRDAIKNSLNSTLINLIRGYLDMIEAIQEQIDELDEEIKRRLVDRNEELVIAMSVPGIGFTAASAALAEIGDYNDFDRAEQLASWSGLVPSVYQSADKLITGKITKQGSKHIRWIFVEIAHAAARTRNSKLRRFYLRIKAKKGVKVAIVALARKILCILWHLLINGEKYEEDGVNKTPKHVKFDRTSSPIEMTVQEMIDVIVKAGYVVEQRWPVGYG